MIVDSHIHYWQPSTPERPWDPEDSPEGAAFSVEDLLLDASAAGVDAVVDITPGKMGDDNRYAFEGARDERVAAVFARLSPRGKGDEERLRELAARPKCAGLRFTFIRPAERVWAEDGSLDPILTLAEELGLMTALFLPRPRELARIIERHPGIPILIDHMAVDHRPVHHDPTYDAFASWSDVLALATFPNAYVKVANVPELSRRPFPYDDLTSRLREIYDAFGPHRVIWGSNYPPSKTAASYVDSVRYVDELPFMSDAEKADFMGGTITALLDRGRTRPPLPTRTATW